MSAAILIGSDPEVFLRNTSTGAFASAHGVIPGSKEEPFTVPLGAVQVDGMACEFNTDPAKTRKEFIDNVTGVFKTLDEMLPDNLSLVPGVPVAHFSEEVFAAQPAEALELGCEPDYDAYTGSENPRPNAHNKPMRTAAGHVHIGFKDTEDPLGMLHMMECCDLVKMLDVFLGLYSLTFDTDTERRSLYGKAGAFRPKPYGVEYRVLSNAWLVSEELIGDVYDIATLTTELYLEGARLDQDTYDRARMAINTSNVKVGAKILADAKKFFQI